MSWFWLNVPLMIVFFLATAGIPLWLVLRHPDRTASPRPTLLLDATPQSVPVMVPVTLAEDDREMARV
jgi:hypothetical protein